MTIIEVPVLPHVKSLLLSMYGAEPIQASENNILGKEVESILMAIGQTELFKDRLAGEKIKLEISARLAPYYQKFRNAFDLGCYFEKQFHIILFTYVEAQIEAGSSQEKAIKNFYNRHKINPELYDIIAARMSLTRLRKKTAA